MKYSFLSFFLLATGVAHAQADLWKAVRVSADLALQMPASTQEMDVPGTMRAAAYPARPAGAGRPGVSG